MFKWMPHKEQETCERKLIRMMKRLKIADFNYNWDRGSCFIEFKYQENSYRMEHSVQNAIEKGIVLRNGMDCLNELVQSLEGLCQIIERGTYKLETWIAGMKQSPSAEEIPEFLEEVHMKYKLIGKQKQSDSEISLVDFDRNQIIQRSQIK
jgi:hypothetical protein